MAQHLAHIALLVKDYDEALSFYVNKLGFILIEDAQISETKRWVLIAPPGNGGCNLLLAKAVGSEQLNCVGNQSGGRVFLFLHTDDFENDYQNLLHHNINIVRQPVQQAYGTVLVFSDLYGNLWDLIGVSFAIQLQ